ncbi:MAG TPA: hypothetical protein VIX90_09420 [Edaphobacter sp.]
MTSKKGKCNSNDNGNDNGRVPFGMASKKGKGKVQKLAGERGYFPTHASVRLRHGWGTPAFWRFGRNAGFSALFGFAQGSE